MYSLNLSLNGCMRSPRSLGPHTFYVQLLLLRPQACLKSQAQAFQQAPLGFRNSNVGNIVNFPQYRRTCPLQNFIHAKRTHRLGPNLHHIFVLHFQAHLCRRHVTRRPRRVVTPCSHAARSQSLYCQFSDNPLALLETLGNGTAPLVRGRR